MGLFSGSRSRLAFRGSHEDYTTSSLNRAILLLAVPMVLESLFAVVDVFWVGRLGAKRRGPVVGFKHHQSGARPLLDLLAGGHFHAWA